MNPSLTEKSIGELKVPSKKSKIKDNVDLVGLSQLSLPPNLSISSLKDQLKSYLSLNNNLLIVLDLMVTTDVMVVLWTMLSLISKITVSC